MKTWKIPVKWEEQGVVEIVSDTLAEAIKIAADIDGVIPVPEESELIDETWSVICEDDVEFVRRNYNNGQPDDIPNTEFKPVIHGEWLSRDPSNPDCPTRYCSNCKADISSVKSLYYKFCPECGAEMRVKVSE